MGRYLSGVRIRFEWGFFCVTRGKMKKASVVMIQPQPLHHPSGRRRVKRTRASIESIGTDLSCLRGAKRTYNTSCVVLHSYLTPMVRTSYRVAAAVNVHAIPSPPPL